MDAQQHQEFLRLVEKAKVCASAGNEPDEIRKGLAYYKRAFQIQKSEKLQNRIRKLEVYLEQLDDNEENSEDGDGDEMVHVGEGFYLYKGLYDKLYDHQRKGILFFWKLWRQKKGGILGDDMGLGKTIQVCAYLAGMFDARRIKAVLIIVPVAVIINWTKEFDQWAPGLDIYTFHDQGKRERERSLNKVQTRGGICLTSYGMAVTSADVLSSSKGREFTWDYVILDEGHKIKNPTTKSAQAVHKIMAKNRIVLSGTPLMNNLKELWALFDWTHFGQLLGSAKTFAMEYENPITRAREKDATAGEQRLGVEMSRSLGTMIAPYFMRRTKAEILVEESHSATNAPHMPVLSRKNDLICWVFLSDIQQRIYRDFIQTEEVRELLSSTKSPLTALTVLKKICDHPRLMTNRQCRQLGLAMTDGGVDLDRLDAMVEEDTAHFNVDHIPDKILIEESGKMIFLIELLDNLKSEGHRCLLFSQSRMVLNIIQKVVKNRGHRFVRIDGTIRELSERQKIIDTFMRDTSYTLFLLTTQVGGVGLTLTAADRVVIYDPSWNPATDSQAVDRAFRIGQEKNVVVYRLITCGSIEEKIYRRQIFKDSINRMTTGDTKNPFRYFTKQDLRELFQLNDPKISATQQQLEQLQLGMRKTDVGLDYHIAFLYSLDMFGISDHDLMFELHARSEVEGEAEMDDEESEAYVKARALKAVDALKSESETNREISEKLGKYPGPQDENLAKLFKTITPAVPSESLKRNFPKPLPVFSSTDLIRDSDQFTAGVSSSKQIHPSGAVENEIEGQLKDLKLEKERLKDESLLPMSSSSHPRTPLNKSNEDFFDDDRFVASKDQSVLFVDDSVEDVKANSTKANLNSTFDAVKTSKLANPYTVLEESLVFSPNSRKPVVSTQIADDGPDDLYLAEKLDLSEAVEDASVPQKRRSSMFKRRSFAVAFPRDSDAEESPMIMKPPKRRAVIASDDEDEEEVIENAGEDLSADELPDLSTSYRKDTKERYESNNKGRISKDTKLNEDKESEEEDYEETREDDDDEFAEKTAEQNDDESEEKIDEENDDALEETGELNEDEAEEKSSEQNDHEFVEKSAELNDDESKEKDSEQDDDESEEKSDEENDDAQEESDEETEEETEDEDEADDSVDVDEFSVVMGQAKEALSRDDLVTAIKYFTEADRMCGGSDQLKKRIALIRGVMDKKRDK